MSGWRVKCGSSFTVALILAAAPLYPDWMKHGSATAAQMDEAAVHQQEPVNAPSGESAEYHTPLAGEPLHTVFMGKALDIPARDRGHVTALILGGEFYTPKQGIPPAPRSARSI